MKPVKNLSANSIKNFATTIMTMGSDPQSFISAKWIVSALKYCPSPLKRGLALRILSLSPHYFYRHMNPEYEQMPSKQFIEAELERNVKARRSIRDFILKPYLNSDYVVLDYGCGPGFLAYSVAEYVRQIFAVDISKGVLECAKIVHSAPNIDYIYAGDLSTNVAARSLDLIYSFAVIQHVTDEVYDHILENCERLIKDDGKIVFHVELDGDNWKSEQAWKDDTSVIGKMRLQYGLNCFARKMSYFSEVAAKHGLKIMSSQPALSITKIRFDDICDGHILVMMKA